MITLTEPTLRRKGSNLLRSNWISFCQGMTSLPVIFICLLLFSAGINSAYSDTDIIHQLTNKMATINNMSGSFIQSKQLHDIPFPIRSEGNFNFNTSGNLEWNMVKPLIGSIHFSPQRMTQTDNGKETLRVETKDQPLAAIISQIFLAVIASDWTTIERHFSINGTLTNENTREESWQLELTPKDSVFKTLCTRIELYGNKHLERFVLYDPSQDKTDIQFRDVVLNQ